MRIKLLPVVLWLRTVAGVGVQLVSTSCEPVSSKLDDVVQMSKLPPESGCLRGIYPTSNTPASFETPVGRIVYLRVRGSVIWLRMAHIQCNIVSVRTAVCM